MLISPICTGLKVHNTLLYFHHIPSNTVVDNSIQMILTNRIDDTRGIRRKRGASDWDYPEYRARSEKERQAFDLSEYYDYSYPEEPSNKHTILVNFDIAGKFCTHHNSRSKK